METGPIDAGLLPERGSDFLQLDAGTAPAKGIATWLVTAIRAAIGDGRLPAGAALPASRQLAADLAVSRGVVVEAYRRLTDEALVVARSGAATVVAASTLARVARPAAQPAPRAQAQAAARVVLPPSPAQADARSLDIDLSPGVPDLSAFPRAAWLRATREALRDATPADLGYGQPQGHEALRQELAAWLGRTRGVRADPGDVIVVSGVAQGLALIAQVLRSRGVDIIAIEDPGSRGARDQLQHWGLRTEPIRVDGEGLDVAALARSEAAAVVVTPAHQFPTGVVLSPQRRRDLLRWAEAGRILVEDDYDAEFRYDRPPVPALHASAPDSVVYVGSTSKSLAPGLRLGWLIAPAPLRDELIVAKHANDIATASLPQLALARLIASGAYDRHLRLVRIRQRERRDALIEALRRHLPQAHVMGVAAGLHLVIGLPELDGAPAGSAIADERLAQRIADRGVRVQPLSWHRSEPGPAGLVVGYAATTPDRLREAAARIAAALADPT